MSDPHSPGRYVYRLVVTSWPTPDGQPFDQQEYEFWEEIVDTYRKRGELPHWLTDITPWLPDGIREPRDGHFIGEHAELDTGYPGLHLLNVPRASTRQYLSRSAPSTMLTNLRAWGCQAYIERAPIGQWETWK